MEATGYMSFGITTLYLTLAQFLQSKQQNYRRADPCSFSQATKTSSVYYC